MSLIAEQAQYVYSPLAEIDGLCELVDLFVGEVPERIATLQRQFAERDFAQLGRTAHQIKGSAGSYGFDCVTPAAARLEHIAKSPGTDEEIARALDSLIHICQMLRAGKPQA